MITQNYTNLISFGITESIIETAHALRDDPGDNPGIEAGRIVAVSRSHVLAQTGTGELWCTIAASVRAELTSEDIVPCAGDWIALRRYVDGSGASVEAVLPRKSILQRRAAGGKSTPQPLAANMDYVFVVMGLDENFNPARLERFATVAWASGAQPVAVLNKADVVEDSDQFVREIERVSPGVPVHAVSATTGTGIDTLRGYMNEGTTAVLIGSSGVGKSTILNRIAGKELRATQEVRTADGKGRHTTSLRELFALECGGCLIDSPGVREVGLWGDETMLDEAFSDVTALAAECRFSDCAHDSEPGCAVKAALESGELTWDRYESYVKLKKEIAFAASRSDERLRRERRKRGKEIALIARDIQKRKRGGRHRADEGP